jgi:hypothetical protein
LNCCAATSALQPDLLSAYSSSCYPVNRVDIDRNRADLGRRELRQAPLIAVGRPDADPVAGADPQGQQSHGESLDFAQVLGIGPAYALVRHGQRLAPGETRGGVIEVIADRDVEQGRRVGASEVTGLRTSLEVHRCPSNVDGLYYPAVSDRHS